MLGAKGHGIQGQFQLLCQIRFNGPITAKGRIFDVHLTIKRNDIFKNNGFHLRGFIPLQTFHVIDGRLFKPPLHRRVHGRTFFFDKGLHGLVHLIHPSFHGHGKNRGYLLEQLGFDRTQFIGPGGINFKKSNGVSLINQGAQQHGPDTGSNGLFLHGQRMGPEGKIRLPQYRTLVHRLHPHRALDLFQRKMIGIGKEAINGFIAVAHEDKNLIVVNGTDAHPQLRILKKDFETLFKFSYPLG